MNDQICPRCQSLLEIALRGVEQAMRSKKLDKESREALKTSSLILERFVAGEGCAWAYGSGEM